MASTDAVITKRLTAAFCGRDAWGSQQGGAPHVDGSDGDDTQTGLAFLRGTPSHSTHAIGGRIGCHKSATSNERRTRASRIG